MISFLYFSEWCKGESIADRIVNKKIIVIDDPISSLSHIHVFNIGRLIHNEFLRTNNYDQIFALTHSLYMNGFRGVDYKRTKSVAEGDDCCDYRLTKSL